MIQNAHLGVTHVGQQLLLSLVELFCGVIAVHGKQVMAKPVHPGEREGKAQPSPNPAQTLEFGACSPPSSQRYH